MLQIEGPAAYDVAANFEERWRKQASEALKAELVDLVSDDFDPTCPGPCDASDMWQCQIFRSELDCVCVQHWMMQACD